jgi:hypothetical protein
LDSEKNLNKKCGPFIFVVFLPLRMIISGILTTSTGLDTKLKDDFKACYDRQQKENEQLQKKFDQEREPSNQRLTEAMKQMARLTEQNKKVMSMLEQRITYSLRLCDTLLAYDQVPSGSRRGGRVADQNWSGVPELEQGVPKLE